MINIALVANAQDTKALINEGIRLSNNKQYTEAIKQFKAALSLEPDNASANYQLAFLLNAIGKGPQSLPYLQKVISSATSAAVIGSSYGLMGSIYDQSGQPVQAIESYKNGIKADTTNKLLWYNLGLAYFRNNQFAEAEESAITSLKADPQHAASMRLYALVTFHQNKRAAAFLGLCSFIWMEPNGTHSAEANENIQHIIQGGSLRAQPDVKQGAPEVRAYNDAITNALSAVAKKKYAIASNQFTAQLQAILTAIGQLAANQKTSGYFQALAACYYQLAQSGNVPAFAHLIKQHIDKNAALWLSSHTKETESLQEWMKANNQIFKTR